MGVEEEKNKGCELKKVRLQWLQLSTCQVTCKTRNNDDVNVCTTHAINTDSAWHALFYTLLGNIQPSLTPRWRGQT